MKLQEEIINNIFNDLKDYNNLTKLELKELEANVLLFRKELKGELLEKYNKQFNIEIIRIGKI